MLDDELSDAPSRSATLYMTRQVIMHAGPGPARDPPAGVDGVRSFDPQGGGWRAISYPLDGADRSMFFYQAGTWVTDFTDPASPVTVPGRTRRRLCPPSSAARGRRTGPPEPADPGVHHRLSRATAREVGEPSPTLMPRLDRTGKATPGREPMKRRLLLAATGLALVLATAAATPGDVGVRTGGGTPGTSRNFTLVGHNPLFDRGMNAAQAIFNNLVYIGNRTDGSNSCGDFNATGPVAPVLPPTNPDGTCPHVHPGILVVDAANPANPTVVGEFGNEFA